MQQALSSLQDRLAPAEEIFFTWLVRVMAAAVLVGSAWIDDAPPLVIGAMIVAFYVTVRVVTQFGKLVTDIDRSALTRPFAKLRRRRMVVWPRFLFTLYVHDRFRYQRPISSIAVSNAFLPCSITCTT